MQVVETNVEGLQRDFKVTVPAGDIEQRVDERLVEFGRDARIPGFRPGKVPLKVLKQRFGTAVLGEVLEAAVRDSSQEVLSERGLRPAGQPQIEVTSFDKGSDLEYEMKVEILPEIELMDLKSMSLERVKVVPTDKEVDDALERIAKQNQDSKPIEEARPAREGDIAILDFVGKVDGEAFDGGTGTGVRLELGSNQFIPGFEEQLIGAEAGKPLEVKVTFPEDYGHEPLAGKDAVFECTITEIQEPVPVTIDEEFATNLGMETLDALKDAVREQLGQEYQRYTRDQVKRTLLDKLAEGHSFEVPPRMFEEEFDQIWKQIEHAKEHGHLDEDDQGKSDEELTTQYREIAERRVRLGLVLSQIGEQNGLTVTQDEVNRAIMNQARQMPGQEQQVIEFYRSNPQAQASLQAPIFEDKVVDFILEMADVTEREVTPEQFTAEIEAENADKEEGEAKPKKKAKAASKSGGKSKAKSKAKDDDAGDEAGDEADKDA